VIILRWFIVVSIFFSFFQSSAQQETVVTGKITEKGTREVLPFVSVYYKGTRTGTTSDFEGRYHLSCSMPCDTLVVSYVGYRTVYKRVRTGETQQINLELEPDVNELREVVIHPGVNPALRIIRLAQQNRDRNSFKNLQCFEYNSYTKLNVSMNNISEKMKEQKMFAPIRSLFDTVNQFKNEEGKYILPVFLSESYSRYYQNNSPSLHKDIILAHNITGYGAEKESYLTDIIGTNVVQFDFYQNWIRYLSKDFISPIADNSMDYYLYTLKDSVWLDHKKCYEIQLHLRREEDLGFLGTIWIADSSFAIKQIHVELAKSANINFIDKLKIQQELVQTEAGPWIPVKSRGIIDIAQVSKNSSGFILKSYTMNSGILVNKPHPVSFYDNRVEKEPDIYERDSLYWNNVRTESFTPVEERMTCMIDSVKKIPAIKTYIDVVRLVIEGHYRIGKFDLGPYVFLLGYNEVEHLRFRFGFRTNPHFSRNMYYKCYVAYGTQDGKFKYGAGADRIINHQRWTTVGFFTKSDYDILGITDASANQMGARNGANIFATLAFAARGSRINKTVDNRLTFVRQIKRDWCLRLTASNTFFAPVGSFVFAYRRNPGLADISSNLSPSFTTTELTGDIRFAYKEVMVNRGIDRLRVVRTRIPALTLSYTRALKNVLNSHFNYQRIQLSIEQHLTTGLFGNADFRLVSGKIFGAIPYPLLDVARGNSTIIYSNFNYGLMNLYEFIADQYSHVFYVQHFEGMFTNRIPLLRRWHLRNFAFIKGCYGHLSDANRNLIPATDEKGLMLSQVYAFKDKPYAEIGFGFENIFRFIQLGYVKRLTYLNNLNVRSWGITMGIALTF
jgi:hypothetical protein